MSVNKQKTIKKMKKYLHKELPSQINIVKKSSIQSQAKENVKKIITLQQVKRKSDLNFIESPNKKSKKCKLQKQMTSKCKNRLKETPVSSNASSSSKTGSKSSKEIFKDAAVSKYDKESIGFDIEDDSDTEDKTQESAGTNMAELSGDDSDTGDDQAHKPDDTITAETSGTQVLYDSSSDSDDDSATTATM